MDVYDAASPGARRNGAVRLSEAPSAPGGSYAGEIGNGPDNTLEFTRVRAAKSGSYRMVVHFANAEFRGGHSYNSQVVDRYAEISVNGGEPQGIYFRNTFDWANFQTRVVDVALEAGENTILFSNPAAGAFAPNIAMIEIALKIAA